MIHHTTKFNSDIHYRFETEIIYESDSTLVVYTPSDTPLKSYRGAFNTHTHILMFYFRDRYHNIHIHWNPDWTPRMHYVNIASKADWDSERVSAIDLDLDLIRFYNSDEIILDDEDEFEENSSRYSYPADLIERCRDEARIIRKDMSSRKGIWSDDIFSWRPGVSLPEYNLP
ncbi:DUF402 domain-containing protein [Spirochaeta isovalerica]|uniref:Protein associated with RNAse G/E n=1 Tax=Spirochaeta isovalerica TaxID=150 RepID=A0A841R823_9SPIO|nr:DUF402 domain-containing protein [Spirochaeta isovalerica]MBB6480023.1 protein associated with RNAse G/E [Spirochaeta isovalerica]